jgi:hypothetical protein
MPNAIKYNVSAETLALKKGNFYIGTGDVGKGPTSSTGYYNGITPPTGGFTIYLNKASGGPSIYTVSTEAQLTGLTNTLSVSTNLIKNNNGGNFTDGTIAPFNSSYGTLPTIVDITNDKPYYGSTSTKAAKFVAGGGMLIYTDPSPFTMTVGVTYTFSFWYRQTNSNNFYIGFNNQGGSGDINGNFQAYSSYGNFSNPTQTWQRCSWTFTNVVNKVYFIINSFNSVAGSECLMTEFTLTEGSMPGGPGLTTSGNCLNWFTTQTDKMIFNRDYESIVTSGLTLNLDAGFSPSFATIPLNANSSTVTPWYDLGPSSKNGSLINGPTFNSANGGSIVFDGVDDKWSVSNITPGTQSFTVECFFKYKSHSLYIPTVLGSGDYWQGGFRVFWGFGQNASQGAYYFQLRYDQDKNATLLNSSMVDDTIYHFVGTRTISGNQQIIKSYKNGSLVETSSPTYIYDLSSQTTLTNQQYVYTGPPPANIYNIKVYNRDLSATDINQNYYAMLNSRMIVTNGLVLNLQAGNLNSYLGSGTAWKDVSGSGNNGTLTNGPTYSSTNGGSIVFDGVDDYAQITSPFGNVDWSSRAWSFSAWVRLSSLGDKCLVNLNSANSTDYIVTNVFYGDGASYWYFIKNSASTQTNFKTPGGTFTTNEIFYFTMTYNGNGLSSSNINFYKNNTQVPTSQGGGAGLSNQTGLQIGGNYPLQGNVYNFLMYNKVLSSTEITQNYNATKGTFGI